MGGLIRRRGLKDASGGNGSHLLYELDTPKEYAKGSYEDTGLTVTLDDTFTICMKYSLLKVPSYSAAVTLNACLWQLKNSGNTSATAKFRHFLNGKYNWTDAYCAGDARLVITASPSGVTVYYVKMDGTVSSVTRTATNASVSNTIQFGSLSGGIWTTFEVWDYEWTEAEATTFLTA